MQLVEQHVIARNDPRYDFIDEAAFKSKNLYNAALYEMRQAFIFQKKRLSYNQMDKLMQQHEAYKALPAKVAQQVLKQLDDAWKGYFEACQAYRAEHPYLHTSGVEWRTDAAQRSGQWRLTTRHYQTLRFAY